MPADSSIFAKPLSAGLLATAFVIAASTFLLDLSGSGPRFLTDLFFQRQDRVGLYVLALLLTALALFEPRLPALQRLPASWKAALVLAVVAGLVAFAGHRLVFGSHVLSRDEAMALFDAQILRSGRFVARVPEEWRDYVPSMLPLFRLPIVDNLGWVSAYLPGNAALHALLGPLTGPSLVAVAVSLAYRVGRQLWPNDPQAAIVAALCLGLSPQVVVMSMTPYAANAHLTLNLLWLHLFLRRSPAGHAGAILTGFFATGLHQIAFHPLFVAPFILGLWWQRAFRLALVYSLAYAVIGLFWILWIPTMLDANGMVLAASGKSVFEDIRQLVAGFSWSGLDLMAKNILRFVGWSFPLTVPLIVLAIAGWRELDGELRALIAGILLTTFIAFVLLPYQGHGWGYRYWHGLCGSFALIAAAGFVRAKAMAPISAHRLLGAAVVVSILGLIPVRALQTHAFAAPWIAAVQALRAAPTEFVVIDRTGMAFSADLVRNDPDLLSRPRMFDLLELSDDSLRRLCARGKVTLFGAREGAAFNMMLFDDTQEMKAREAQLLAVMSAMNCAQPLPLTSSR